MWLQSFCDLFTSQVAKAVQELHLAKVLVSFVGRSGSSFSAFYLYRTTNAGLSSTPNYAHTQASKDLADVR